MRVILTETVDGTIKNRRMFEDVVHVIMSCYEERMQSAVIMLKNKSIISLRIDNEQHFWCGTAHYTEMTWQK